MATPADERTELEKLQRRLAKKDGFEEARQRLRRTQRLIAHRKREIEVFLHSTRGEWKAFRVYGSCRE